MMMMVVLVVCDCFANEDDLGDSFLLWDTFAVTKNTYIFDRFTVWRKIRKKIDCDLLNIEKLKVWRIFLKKKSLS